MTELEPIHYLTMEIPERTKNVGQSFGPFVLLGCECQKVTESVWRVTERWAFCPHEVPFWAEN
jgi:hypothetical protein